MLVMGRGAAVAGGAVDIVGPAAVEAPKKEVEL